MTLRKSHVCTQSFHILPLYHSHFGQHPHQGTAWAPIRKAYHQLSFLQCLCCSHPCYPWKTKRGRRHLSLAPWQYTGYSSFTKYHMQIALRAFPCHSPLSLGLRPCSRTDGGQTSSVISAPPSPSSLLPRGMCTELSPSGSIFST